MRSVEHIVPVTLPHSGPTIVLALRKAPSGVSGFDSIEKIIRTDRTPSRGLGIPYIGTNTLRGPTLGGPTRASPPLVGYQPNKRRHFSRSTKTGPPVTRWTTLSLSKERTYVAFMCRGTCNIYLLPKIAERATSYEQDPRLQPRFPRTNYSRGYSRSAP